MTKVLIITADGSNVELESRVLRYSGCSVEVMRNLPEDLAKNRPSVVLLSPEADAVSSLSEMGGIDIPFVVMVNEGEERRALQLLQKGAGDYIIKTDNFYLLLPGVIQRLLQAVDAQKQVVRLKEELRDVEEDSAWKEKLTSTAELTAGVVHEIRNPLSIIAMSVQYLVPRIEKGDPRRAFAEAILRKVEKIDKITKDLVKFGKPRAPVSNSCEMNGLIRSVLALVRPRCEQNKIEIVEGLSEPSLELTADRDGLEEVLLNLFNNAVDAMPGGGTLTVAASLRDSKVFVEVSDTGKGIAEEDLERVFLPFFSKKENGTGLGLAVCRRLIAEHGGKIRVENSNDGAKFVFYIPQR